MERTTTRPLTIQDLDALEIPMRNKASYRDGGSWSAEAYMDNRWVIVEHNVAQKVTTVDGRAAIVETTIKLGLAA
jgi:hypothetical protein